jgi:hypothetical protein
MAAICFPHFDGMLAEKFIAPDFRLRNRCHMILSSGVRFLRSIRANSVGVKNRSGLIRAIYFVANGKGTYKYGVLFCDHFNKFFIKR